MSHETTPKQGNPAVVGLAGFGLTTLLLQIHNLADAGLSIVIACGLIFGGLAQMIAGLQEQKMGNNFGYSAFTSYGAFWIALCFIFLAKKFGWYEVSTTDIGWFLAAWGLYSLIMFFAAIRIHGAMAFTFLTLVLGFAGLVIGHFGFPIFNKIAAGILIVTALSAWYMMAGAIYADVYGKTILPMGKPWIKG